MRSNPVEFELIAPGSLEGVMSILANEPGEWLPIAGGTDVMVLYAAGKLPARKLVSIWNLPELRRINVRADEVEIGAACTYRDFLEHDVVTKEFPLLASAARWTGGIANQNRGTLGGNIINASPAADSLPALLVYEADLTLVCARGERVVPYSNFHTGYKTTQLAGEELIRAVRLRRRFSNYFAYARKVGARNAQAISKACMAALGKLSNGLVEEVRIAVGSVAPVPLRLRQTEKIVIGRRIEPALLTLAKKTAIGEIKPIDDIRSTARYRTAIVGNLVAEFLARLQASQKSEVTQLDRWNRLAASEAENEILPCCGSGSWARLMAGRRPITDQASMLAASDETWWSLPESDWMEAFRSHPRIGETAAAATSIQSRAWSAQEQGNVSASGEAEAALAEGNREYERRFGHIFIVCASGKSAAQILEILHRRLQNEPAAELREAAEQQRQITHIRLKKWLQG